MGGRKFQVFFEKFRPKITYLKGLNKFLDYYKEGTGLATMIFRSAGLTPDPAHCPDQLSSDSDFFVCPDVRVNVHIALPSTQRMVVREIWRWMTHGSIIPWVEGLASRAGSTDGMKAGKCIAREILFVGTTLATMLEKFHPARVTFSATMERLTRRLVILEESLNLKMTSSDDCTRRG